MKNKFNIIILLSFLIFGCSPKAISTEVWIDYDDVSKISLRSSQNMVVSSLGEPVLITADQDGGNNIIYLYYNYHVKKYLPNKEKEDINDVRATNFERNTLLKFTFEDDELIGWEEDKLTMSTAMPTIRGRGRAASILTYVSYLLNLILIIKVF